jgi:DNA-binding HxlR family transcriptional regulator
MLFTIFSIVYTCQIVACAEWVPPLPYEEMRDTNRQAPTLCAKFHRASELIGRKWTGAIIYVLLRSRCRFATLREAIPEITDRMLSERLQELEEEQILQRIVIPEMPVRVEYALTEKGQALSRAIDAIGRWAEEWGNVDVPRASARRVARSQPGRRARVSSTKGHGPRLHGQS